MFVYVLLYLRSWVVLAQASCQACREQAWQLAKLAACSVGHALGTYPPLDTDPPVRASRRGA